MRLEQSLQATRALQRRIDAALGPAGAGATLDRDGNTAARLRRVGVKALTGMGLTNARLDVATPDTLSISATGSLRSLLTLIERAGDVREGLFVRTVALRRAKGQFEVTLDSSAIRLPKAPPRSFASEASSSFSRDPFAFGGGSIPGDVALKPARTEKPRITAHTQPMASPTPATQVNPPQATPPEARPPFVLQAIIQRPSGLEAVVLFGGALRVLRRGDTLGDWRCVSISADQGLALVGPSGEKATLMGLPPER